MSEEEFINSVETVLPNPPFKINIQTSKQKKVRDQNSFKKITASSLKNHSWDENENIKTFDISLNKKNAGIIGSAIVAILESHNQPTDRIDINSRDIEIEGENYTLNRNLRLSENKIIEESTSIMISDDGDIREEDSTRYLVSSESRISLHGIEVPSTLFP